MPHLTVEAISIRMSKTILIIEDNAAVVNTMKSVLELEGYTVHAASNGEEGIAALKRIGTACVVLLDMMMPVMNGWHFLDFQRSRPEYADIPVIVISAFGEIARSVKPQEYIPKPVKLDLLLTTVQKYCA
jgi:CheY-like chemotaxis protein